MMNQKPKNQSQRIKKIVDSSQTIPRIIDTSPTVERLDPAMVAKALGGKPTGIATEVANSPPALFALRQKLFSEIVSSGGRPSLKGKTVQKKIRVREDDWKYLQKITKKLSNEEQKITPTHLAGVIISRAVAEMKENGEHKPEC